MSTAVLEPTADTADAIQITEAKDHVADIPEFVTRIHQDYLAQVAHTFIISGNVFDYMDPQGSRMFILDVLAAQFDTAVKRNNAAFARTLGHNVTVKDKKNQVLAFFEAGKGLAFMTKASRDAWLAFMNSAYSEEVRAEKMIVLEPIDFGDVVTTLNWYFKASKERMIANKTLIQNAIAVGDNPNSVMLDEEINVSVVFMDAPFNVPNGDLCHMESDRGYMAMIRAWSRDLELGNRNKIIFVTGSLQDMNEVLRSGDAFINCVTVKKPNLAERETWLHRYDENLRTLAARPETAQKINGKAWRHINLAEGETLKDIAIQAAGMNFKQMEGPIVCAATRGEALSRSMIRKVKQELLEKEYGGVLEFIEPEFGFEIIGGHEHLIKYARERIIAPLRKRRKEICSRGLLLTGPPGCQPAGSLVLMADGDWKAVELVQVGDKVISPQHDGSCVVATVTETVVYEDRDVFEIATKGRSRKSYRCADNHVLPYLALKRPRTSISDKEAYVSSEQGRAMSKIDAPRPKRHSVLEERQVRQFLTKGQNYQKKARIFTTTAVEFPEQEFPVHPYVLGVLLGDGCLTKTSPELTNADMRIFRKLRDLGVEFGDYENNGDRCYTEAIIGKTASAVRSLSVNGLNSHTKRVPTEYKTGSIQQRLDLLAGLIDTDGSIDSYSTASEALAKDFVNLVHSVGGLASYRERTTYCDGKPFRSFRVNFSFAEYAPTLVSDHKQRPPRNMEWKNPRNRAFSVTYVGKEGVFGFVLDSPSEWYVTDDWLVTHNTGKTEWATCLAKEADMSFVLLHMDKLKDSLVGGSEKLMRKLLEALRAAAPCIAFMDEIDSVYGPTAREGARDGGVQSGQFNEFMKFASDPSRVGEIVLVAATNRPDMLDSALVRPGRFDDILPALPPRIGDWKGRMAILFAIMNRKKAKFTPDMQFDIEKGPVPDKGLGPFAFDKRLWTGAEINKLVEDAVLNASLNEDDRKAQFADKYQFRVTGDDWAAAFHNVLPKTGNVQGMINCALYFMNNLRYCPVGWHKEATSRKDLAKSLKESYPSSAAQFDRE